jgi:hypothetical protein
VILHLLPQKPISCGNRKDLPKKQRRHDYEDRGIDLRHDPDKGDYRPRWVRVCLVCGRDNDISLSKVVVQ